MDMIKTGKAPIQRYLQDKAMRTRAPLFGTFELTPRCNMNCRMCYIRMSEEEMRARGREFSAAEWITMGRVCRDAGTLFLLLTGGEAFLRPDFREIYTALHEMGFLISVNSNATLIDETTVEWLRRVPPSRVNVTLYGGSNETYARLCRNPQGFDQATRGIRLLRQAGIPVVLNASFTRANVADMEAVFTFAHEQELVVRPSAYMFPPLRSAHENVTDDIRFSPEEAGEAMARLKACSLTPELFAKVRRQIRAGLPCETEEDDDCPRTADECMGCMAGRCSFWMTWDGRMTPCGMMNEPVAHPFADGFAESWQAIVQGVEPIRLPSACGACRYRPYCRVCGAVALAEGQGDSTRRPDYMCRMTETYVRRLCEE